VDALTLHQCDPGLHKLLGHYPQSHSFDSPT
jgi:hypothetical protein